eukprot:6105846-Alexandrium_andersonii.AAC.2
MCIRDRALGFDSCAPDEAPARHGSWRVSGKVMCGWSGAPGANEMEARNVLMWPTPRQPHVAVPHGRRAASRACGSR